MNVRVALVSAGLLLLAASLAGDTRETANTSDFVEVPGGDFIMGADPQRDPDAFDNERWSPAAGEGRVFVPAFFIGRHEVTVADFATFVRERRWNVDQRALAGPPTHPVTFVSWPDALAYCRWLEAALRSAGSTPAAIKESLANGWRVTLPNEAEWEKAARGTDGRRYPWGRDPLGRRANFSGSGPMPVGSFPCPECPHGLADMSGNVAEWTSSPYQPYPYDASDDRALLDVDALWVIRGGHFADGPRLARTTARVGADPGARRAFIGFRVAIAKR
jgi:formylglycine-generating enzyme required for sulfatase activity